MLLYLAIFSYLAIFILLAALAWRDLKEYILPNKLNLSLAFAFITFHSATHWQIISLQSAIIGAAVGGGMLLGIRYAANRYYKQDSLGLGDVKLMAAAGLGLGFPDILMAMSLGAFAGLLHGGVMACVLKQKTGKWQNFATINVPAGLGLTAGIAIVMVIRFGFGWVVEK